jgi:hypothetical protein
MSVVADVLRSHLILPPVLCYKFGAVTFDKWKSCETSSDVTLVSRRSTKFLRWRRVADTPLASSKCGPSLIQAFPLRRCTLWGRGRARIGVAALIGTFPSGSNPHGALRLAIAMETN